MIRTLFLLPACQSSLVHLRRSYQLVLISVGSAKVVDCTEDRCVDWAHCLSRNLQVGANTSRPILACLDRSKEIARLKNIARVGLGTWSRSCALLPAITRWYVTSASFSLPCQA